MSNTAWTDELQAAKKEAWKRAIITRFALQPTSVSVTWKMGDDFSQAELPWIRDKLLPWLDEQPNMQATIEYFGVSTGCQCSGSCPHSPGRVLRVTLV